MFENINGRTKSISDCEINGVIVANHWRLTNSSGDDNQSPEYPDAQYIGC